MLYPTLVSFPLPYIPGGHRLSRLVPRKLAGSADLSYVYGGGFTFKGDEQPPEASGSGLSWPYTSSAIPPDRACVLNRER